MSTDVLKIVERDSDITEREREREGERERENPLLQHWDVHGGGGRTMR